MSAFEDFDDLVFPDTIEDTEAAIADLVGTIADIRAQIDAAKERHDMGGPISWDWFHRAQHKIAFLRGDEAALKRHCRALRREEKARLEEEAIERRKAAALEKAANVAKQEQIARDAAAARQARQNNSLLRTNRRWGVSRKSYRDFIAANWPDRLAEADVAALAAEAQFDAENPA